MREQVEEGVQKCSSRLAISIYTSQLMMSFYSSVNKKQVNLQTNARH